MHVNPVLWETEEDGSLEVRSSSPAYPGQHGETLTLLKIQELAGSQLLRRLRQENHLNMGDGGCSEQRLHHFTTAWVTE